MEKASQYFTMAMDIRFIYYVLLLVKHVMQTCILKAFAERLTFSNETNRETQRAVKKPEMLIFVPHSMRFL